MPRPSHSSRFYHPNNIWWAVQVIKLLILYFSPLPCYFVPPRSKYSPLTPYSQTKDVVPTFRNYSDPRLERSSGWCCSWNRRKPCKGRMAPFRMSRCSRHCTTVTTVFCVVELKNHIFQTPCGSAIYKSTLHTFLVPALNSLQPTSTWPCETHLITLETACRLP